MTPRPAGAALRAGGNRDRTVRQEAALGSRGRVVGSEVQTGSRTTPVAEVRPLPSGVGARWQRALPGGAGREGVQRGLPPALDPAGRERAMTDLRQRAATCTRCAQLAAARTSVVVGVGDVNARLMFVGEAPGAEEDRQGEPFVGAAGELLTRMIKAMDLSRERVFIANILKCRPDTPSQASGNRKPTAEEMATCLPWLEEQIEIIQPAVMVALGATAVEGLLGNQSGITRLRGRWQRYRGIPVMPTFHPAYLLRKESAGEKRKVWEDMLAVMERLGLPISARQRGFFLPKPGGGSAQA
ncbi:MAG: uracil-DNA glycosylase [Verrucomicrobiae bacterium]|nr:uracil-DNA glycosylase [Verrucomicrobiae bacterium]